MKNYVKPLVVANAELAEGIYAASGGQWTATPIFVPEDSTLNTSHYDIEFSYNGGEPVPAQCNVGLRFDVIVNEFSAGSTYETNSDSFNFVLDTNGQKTFTIRMKATVSNTLGPRPELQGEVSVK